MTVLSPNLYPTSTTTRSGPSIMPPAPYTGGSTTQTAPAASWQGGGDLRSTLALPTTAGRLGMAQSMTDSWANRLFSSQMPEWGSIAQPDFSGARNQIGEASSIYRGLPGYGGAADDTRQARTLANQALESLSYGPDREALTERAWLRLLESGQPGYEQDLRKVNQYAAAGGRLGSGMTTNELTDVYTQRQRDLDRSREGLIDQAVSQQMQDRLLQMQAAQSIYDQFAGSDRSDAALRNELEARRAAGLSGTAGQLADLEQAGYAARDRERTGAYDAGYRGLQGQSNILSQLSGLEGQIFGQGVQERGEFRGERDWQNMLQQQSLDRAIQQMQLQDQLYGNQFNREQARLGLLGGTGYVQPNVNPLLAGSQQAQQQANSLFGVAGDLLGGWARNRTMSGSGSVGTPPIAGYYGNQPGTYYYGV